MPCPRPVTAGVPALQFRLVLAPGDIDAVIFDLGGVFMVPDPIPVAVILDEVGITLEASGAAAVRAHYTGIRAITELHLAGGVDETDPGTWRSYDLAWFEVVGVPTAEIERAIDARDAHRRGSTKVGHVWTHALRHNIDALAEIAERRPVAVVSNNDGTAADQCRQLGVCQVGDGRHTRVTAIVDSGVIGISKPDPRIFEPALASLGTDRSRTLYVGDTVHADVMGATAAGMPVVQLDPEELHADHDHWRLPDVTALSAHLR